MAAKLAASPVQQGIGPRFVSPSGNIYCSIERDSGVSGCEITKGRTANGDQAECLPGGGADTVGRIEFEPDGPNAICNDDSIRVDGVPELPYGTVAAVEGNPWRCLSERTGMTCLDTAREVGFTVARGVVRIF